MKRWSHLSIRYKLFLTFSFVISLTVAMISVVFYFNNVREMKQEVQSTSNILSRQFDKTLDLYIQDIERLSLAVFTDPVIQSSLIKHSQPEEEESGVQTKNVIYPQLFNHVYPRKHVESVSIYTNNGIVYEYTKKGQIEVGYYDKAEGWVEELDQKGKEEFLLLPTTKYSINGH